MHAVAIVELTDQGFRKVARCRLNPAGVVEITPAEWARTIANTYVPDLDDPGRRRLHPEDGERFLRGLLHAFHGTYQHARISD